MIDNADKLMTKNDAAAYLRTTTRSIDRMVASGRLKPLYLTRTGKRFRQSTLDAVLATTPTERAAMFGAALAAE